MGAEASQSDSSHISEPTQESPKPNHVPASNYSIENSDPPDATDSPEQDDSSKPEPSSITTHSPHRDHSSEMKGSPDPDHSPSAEPTMPNSSPPQPRPRSHLPITTAATIAAASHPAADSIAAHFMADSTPDEEIACLSETTESLDDALTAADVNMVDGRGQTRLLASAHGGDLVVSVGVGRGGAWRDWPG